MAAIICREFGNILSACCTATGKVLCLPCQLCGIATETACDVVCSPFFLYLLTAFGLNVPPVVFAWQATATAADDGEPDCGGTYKWIVWNGILCLCHIVAAVYIVSRIQSSNELKNLSLLPKTAQDDANGSKSNDVWKLGSHGENETRSKSYARMKEVLCDDPGVALYIIVIFVYLVWTVNGIFRSFGDCDNLQDLAQNALWFNFAFISLGGGAFCCSLCCLW